MINILFTSTRGGAIKLQTATNEWSAIAQKAVEAGVRFDDMKITLVRSEKRTYNVGLEEGSLVPLEEGNLIIQLTQQKMKGAMDYEIDFTLDEIKEMQYRELRVTLRNFRGEAQTHGDESILSIIGNYTHDSVDQLREKLTKVYKALIEVEEEQVVPDADFRVFVSVVGELVSKVERLNERVLNLEVKNLVFSEEAIEALQDK